MTIEEALPEIANSIYNFRINLAVTKLQNISQKYYFQNGI
jgi:hypothetical protein